MDVGRQFAVVRERQLELVGGREQTRQSKDALVRELTDDLLLLGEPLERDPVERAYSAYNYNLSRGMEPAGTFAEIDQRWCPGYRCVFSASIQYRPTWVHSAASRPSPTREVTRMKSDPSPW